MCDAKEKKKLCLLICKPRDEDLGRRLTQVGWNLALDVGAWQKNEEERMKSENAKVEGGAGGILIIYFVDTGLALVGCTVRAKNAS